MSKDCSCGGTHGGCSCHGDSPESVNELIMSLEREEALRQIKHKVIVLSGKGGVGKSTVAVNLAVSLGLMGNKVGLLDVDIHGPSVPKMLNLEGHRLESTGQKLIPAEVGNIKVISIGFLLEDADNAVIWRGPMKAGVIKQFVEEVDWGELDYLVVDCPPGTGDEPLSVIQTLGDADGAVVVTTPQDVALVDVRKSISFCHQVNLAVLGVVENMSGFVCPHCGEVADVFKSGGGERMADQMNVPFLGRVPLDPLVVTAGDAGTPYIYEYAKSSTAQAFEAVVGVLADRLNPDSKETDKMLIALPTSDGQLCKHFGHCERLSIFEVDADEKRIIAKTVLVPPPHEPGLLPRWLRSEGVRAVIAGGMGERAKGFLAASGIEVIIGAVATDPDTIVMDYLNGTLETRDEVVCDH